MGTPTLALIMMDLDNFKNINDTHGHLAVDAVLREAARRLHESLRQYDTVGRSGGEEFVAVVVVWVSFNPHRRPENRLDTALLWCL
jgi:diguanylate cyclase (GGDEF)-like protein